RGSGEGARLRHAHRAAHRRSHELPPPPGGPRHAPRDRDARRVRDAARRARLRALLARDPAGERPPPAKLAARDPAARGERLVKTFVTGSTGMVGNAIARLLAREGHEVVALARSVERARKVLPAEVTVTRGDVTEPAT